MFPSLQPGRYVIAVSGGVDSIVLLDLLRQNPDLQLVVAHFDHGIREDSPEDRKLVQMLAQQHGLPFVYDEGNLGKNASEAAAREARYDFLHKVRENTDSQAVITAHHQDDLLETAFLNLLRGTGRKGLSSLDSTDFVQRPLLHVPKKHLTDYAKANGLLWREDSTNTDQKYKRNYVRSQLIAKLTPMQRHKLLSHVRHMKRLNEAIDKELANQLHVQPEAQALDVRYFRLLPHDVAMEVLAAWLRNRGIRDFDKKGLNRIVIAAKTLSGGQQIDVNQTHVLEVKKDTLALKARDR